MPGFLVDWMGPTIVGLYAWISFLSQLLLHWKINKTTQNVYMTFKDTLPQEKLALIISPMDCRMNFQNALIFGIVGGFFIAFFIIVLSRSIIRGDRYSNIEEFRQYTRKTRQLHAIVYLASLAYFLVLILIFLLIDPHGFLPVNDVIYGVIISGIIGASLVLTTSYKRTNYSFKTKYIAITYWKMAHSSGMQFFNTVVWTFLTILIAFGAAVVMHFLNQMPPEISYSTQYGTVIVCWILRALIPVLGAGLGILMPSLDRVKLIENKVAEMDFMVSNETQVDYKEQSCTS